MSGRSSFMIPRRRLYSPEQHIPHSDLASCWTANSLQLERTKRIRQIHKQPAITVSVSPSSDPVIQTSMLCCSTQSNSRVWRTCWTEVRAIWIWELGFMQQLVQSGDLLSVQIPGRGLHVCSASQLINQAACLYANMLWLSSTQA